MLFPKEIFRILFFYYILGLLKIFCKESIYSLKNNTRKNDLEEK